MKMKIEVWSDIMCPYCYIGKLHYEKALQQFEYKDQIELEWKAFLLNPDLPGKGKGIPGLPGISVEQRYVHLEGFHHPEQHQSLSARDV